MKASNLEPRRFGINILALIACGLLIAAMFFPWWSFALEWTERTDLFPYIIRGPGSELVGYKRSPTMALLTGVLIACILLSLAGSFLKGKAARIVLAISGVVTLLASWRLYARVAGVAARFEIPVHGGGQASYEIFAVINVWTALQPGLFLAIAAGILALLACLLYPKLRLRW